MEGLVSTHLSGGVELCHASIHPHSVNITTLARNFESANDKQLSDPCPSQFRRPKGQPQQPDTAAS